MRKQYSAEFKAKVVREVLREEKPLSQIAASHGIHPNVVTQWRDQALLGLVGIFNHQQENDWAAQRKAHEQEVEELYAEIGRLTTQLTWLKKKVGAVE
jgi:transposase-like protein